MTPEKGHHAVLQPIKNPSFFGISLAKYKVTTTQGDKMIHTLNQIILAGILLLFVLQFQG